MFCRRTGCLRCNKPVWSGNPVLAKQTQSLRLSGNPGCTQRIWWSDSTTSHKRAQCIWWTNPTNNECTQFVWWANPSCTRETVRCFTPSLWRTELWRHNHSPDHRRPVRNFAADDSELCRSFLLQPVWFVSSEPHGESRVWWTCASCAQPVRIVEPNLKRDAFVWSFNSNSDESLRWRDAEAQRPSLHRLHPTRQQCLRWFSPTGGAFVAHHARRLRGAHHDRQRHHRKQHLQRRVSTDGVAQRFRRRRDAQGDAPDIRRRRLQNR